jgi:hypothetical protein
VTLIKEGEGRREGEREGEGREGKTVLTGVV